jgi:hypothetical protein
MMTGRILCSSKCNQRKGDEGGYEIPDHDARSECHKEQGHCYSKRAKFTWVKYTLIPNVIGISLAIMTPSPWWITLPIQLIPPLAYLLLTLYDSRRGERYREETYVEDRWIMHKKHEAKLKKFYASIGKKNHDYKTKLTVGGITPIPKDDAIYITDKYDWLMSSHPETSWTTVEDMYPSVYKTLNFTNNSPQVFEEPSIYFLNDDMTTTKKPLNTILLDTPKAKNIEIKDIKRDNQTHTIVLRFVPQPMPWIDLPFQVNNTIHHWYGIGERSTSYATWEEARSNYYAEINLTKGGRYSQKVV